MTTPVIEKIDINTFIKGRFKVDYDELPTRAKMLITRLDEYIEAMNPFKAKNTTEIIKQQTNLLNTYLGILSSESDVTAIVWETLLFQAKQNADGVFSPRAINQHYNQLPVKSRDLFANLNALIIGSADAGSRKIFLSRYRLDIILKDLPTDKQRANLTEFYAKSI